MTELVSIKGAGGGGGKGGSKNARKPDIQKDSVASVSTLKELLGLSEGEIEGFVTDDPRQSIYLENTPLADDNGNDNFSGVSYEFVEGTNDQDYIKGFPDVSNEIGVNVELKQGTPYVKAINNTQLSATRVRLRFGRLAETNVDNGDVTGTKVEYAIDLQTDGGAYETIVNGVVNDKASAGYERTHRIDLPKANTGWQIRVRRLTPNSDSDLIQNDMFVDAIAEVIDAKLRYPNTAMLGLSYDAETFQSVAKVAVHLKGKRILVPSNYNAYERTYTGLWNGTFKEAYSNNPAWVMYDLLTQWRYGLGDRIDASMVDKWSLYQLGQYCDQMVDDGKGGQEPRFTCNVYLQKQEDAFKVLSNIAGIFRAMSYWNGERIVLDADMPQDPVYTFSRANVVDGLFNYTGSRARDRHTLVKVAWDNPANNYQTEYEFVRDERGMAKYGVRVLDLSAFACTSQAQAQRAGLWALETEQLETRQVSFAVGLDGFIPQVGNIINVSDELFAGRANGGRVSKINGSQITLDRDVTTGDTLVINGRDGKSERRTITAIDGNVVTVSTAFNNAEVQNVWAIESADLMLMQFRVMSITQNDDMTFNITALQHEPQKYDAIDYGVHVEPTPITVINPDTVRAPDYVNLSATYRVVQGQNVATLVIEWEQVKDAVAYEVEWRKDNGTWIRLPRTGNTSIDIEGIYSGKYQARVRSISAFDVSSQPKVSNLTDIKGKVGKPNALTMLRATGLLFGMRLEWAFASGSGDTAYTEIEQATAPDTNVSLLGQFSYPTDNHDITGLQGGLTLYYRARIVDKLGFKSDWTEWVSGVTDNNADKVLDLIDGQIKESHLYESLSQKIDKIDPIDAKVEQEIQDRIDDISDIAQQVALVSSGIGEQFDSLKIWHFDRDDEGWSGGVYNKGYINARTNTLVSPSVEIDGSKYKHVKLRIEKVGNPTWSGLVTWSGGSTTIPTPEFQDGVATVGVSADWADSLNGFNVKLADTADNLNYYKVDWIAVGRPSPGASFAALLDEKEQRQQGDKANAQKIEGVVAFTGADSDMAGSTEDLAGDNLNLAGSWSVYDAIIEGDNAQASRIDAVTSKINDNQASVMSEIETLADNDTAISSRVDSVVTEVNSNISALRSDIESTTDGLSTRLDNVETQQSEFDNNLALTQQAITTASDELSAQSNRIDTVQSATVNAQSTANNALSKVNVANQNIATIESDLSAVTTQSGATASQVETLQTTVNGHTSSIQTQQTSIDGLSAQSTLTLDVNGYVTGIGSYNDGKKGTFAVRADEFWVASPDNKSKVKPLVYYAKPTTINGVTIPSGLYLDGNIVATGSITGDKIRAETEINAPTIKGGQININNKFIVDSQGNLTGKSGTFEGTVLADKISGTIDVESMKRSAWTPGYKVFTDRVFGDRLPTSFDRTYSGTHASYGSIILSFGSGYTFSMGTTMFEIKVLCDIAKTVRQRLLSVDNSIIIYLNNSKMYERRGDQVGLGQTITYNLAQGLNTIQVVMANEGGPAQLVLLGDFIDNKTVKFA